jgi:hypothetical protein
MRARDGVTTILTAVAAGTTAEEDRAVTIVETSRIEATIEVMTAEMTEGMTEGTTEGTTGETTGETIGETTTK